MCTKFFVRYSSYPQEIYYLAMINDFVISPDNKLSALKKRKKETHLEHLCPF